MFLAGDCLVHSETSYAAGRRYPGKNYRTLPTAEVDANEVRPHTLAAVPTDGKIGFVRIFIFLS